MTQRSRIFVTAVMVGLGLWLVLSHHAGGSVWVFALAAAAAAGTRPGLALGGLTLIAGLATQPVPAPAPVLETIGMVAVGIGLGLVARELERLHLRVAAPLALGALVALAAAFALALPDGPVRLASAAGAPLMLPAIVVDGGSFMRLSHDLPAVIDLVTPGGSLSVIALFATVIAAIVLLIAHLRGATAQGRDRPLHRGAWELAAVAAALGLVTGLLGLAQLLGLFGDVALDPIALRRALDLAASRDAGVIDLVAPASAELRLWSRPWIDGLRLLPALALLILAIRQAGWRGRSAVPVPVPAAPAPALGRPLSPSVIAALAITAAGSALVAAAGGLEGPPLALLGGLVIGTATLVSTRAGAFRPSSLVPLVTLSLCAFVWVYAWLVTPLFGA